MITLSIEDLIGKWIPITVAKPVLKIEVKILARLDNGSIKFWETDFNLTRFIVEKDNKARFSEVVEWMYIK